MNAVSEAQSLRDLYRELVLDHARNPRNFGKLDGPSHTAEGINPLCGDSLVLYLDVGADDRVRGASFEGTGCVISIASASLLTETIVGMRTADAARYVDVLRSRLSTDPPAAPVIDLGELQALEGVREYPSRVKCATLAWHALDAALRGNDTPATTE